ncbi:MAG: TrmH family RNA methyltransferase [Cellvibrionaceae bacterium]
MKKIPKNLLTIYGRNPVHEALLNNDIHFYRVHIASSNKPNTQLKDIARLCKQRGIEIQTHDRLSLSRISKNRKQDQGIAADIIASNFKEFDDFISHPTPENFSLIAVENVTNPQNLGMIIRSVGGGFIDGLIIPRKGCSKIDGLVIKASAGTLFKTNILFCDDIPSAIKKAKALGVSSYGLALEDSTPLNNASIMTPNIFVLGNETDGLSKATLDACTQNIHIPMNNNVESLNVAVTAALLSFRTFFKK